MDVMVSVVSIISKVLSSQSDLLNLHASAHLSAGLCLGFGLYFEVFLSLDLTRDERSECFVVIHIIFESSDGQSHHFLALLGLAWGRLITITRRGLIGSQISVLFET